MKTEAMHAVELSDTDLVGESLSGDRDAFGHIVERYQNLIASLAYCATGDVNQSEDLAQETFVTAWKQLGQLREPAKLRPWLCGIARFLIAKEFRRQGREPTHAAQSLEALEDWRSPEPLPPEHAISQEELSLLWRSLERIPPVYREPLVLFYREHQSIEAVADGLGLSEDAVKQRLSRGRKLLQEEFMTFIAGALDQTRPGKTFALGVLAALPLLASSAKAATVGTTLAKPGGVAAKATGSGGFLQAVANGLAVMVYWLNAAVLPLGGYIGYKMGGDSRNSERARRSVATFWRIIGMSLLVLFWLPVLLLLLVDKITHLPEAKIMPLMVAYVNLALPGFMFGVVPLALVFWLWQRRRRTVPEAALQALSPGRTGKSFSIWVMLSMTLAFAYLAFLCWSYNIISHLPVSKTMTRSLSTSEVQELIASPKGRAIRFTLEQFESGARRLYGDRDEHGVPAVVAPAEQSTLALLNEKGIQYETKLETQENPHPSRAAFEAQRLLQPFSCFILVAGAVTLLRARRQPGAEEGADTPRERRVDRGFAAFAACGMLVLAVAVGWTTDWKVTRIAASQVASVVARGSNARFEVFEYFDGSRKLWISNNRAHTFIAPANEVSLGLLARQGIRYQTYAAGYAPGAAGRLGRSQSTAVLWMLALAAAAGGLSWWAAKGQPLSG